MADDIGGFDMLMVYPTHIASTRRLKDGVEIPISDASGQGEVVFVPLPKKAFLVPTHLSRGVTISLGDYEFARIDAGITGWAAPAAAESMYTWASAALGELLLREEAKVKREQREQQPLPPPPKGVNHLVVTFGYGITKKGPLTRGSRTSIKSDVMLTAPCSTAGYESCVADLAKQCTEILRKEHAAAKNAPHGF